MASFKLIFRNVYKNIRDYLIYFITLMLSVSLFYAFNAALSPSVFETLNTSVRNMSDALRNLIAFLSYIVAGMLAFLIVYANQFLLKRRKKELGLYLLLGMDRIKISIIFIGETFFIGLLSLVSGLIAGIPLSQGLSIMALRLFGGDVNNFRLVLSASALSKTMLCFATIYIVVMAANTFNISALKLIDLLRAERKNQSIRTKSRFVNMLWFAVAAALFLFAAVALTQWQSLYPGKRTAICILAGIAGGTFLFFYSAFAVALDFAKSRKNVYLKNLNTFLFGQIESRAHTNFLSISIVCLLLSVTILLTVTGFSMTGTMDKRMKEALISDIAVIIDTEKLGDADVLERAKEYGADLEPYLKNSVQVASYRYENGLAYSDVFEGRDVELWRHHEALPGLPLRFIGISDYNACLEFAGRAPVELSEDEFLVNCVAEDVEEELRGFLQEAGQITVAGQNLKARQVDLLKNVWFLSGVGNNDYGTFIIPDSAAGNLRNAEITMLANYKPGVDAVGMEPIVYSLTNEKGNTANDALDYGFLATTKYMQRNIYISLVALPVYLCLYLGTVFLIICVTLLALQQLTETADNVKRYELLGKLGSDKDTLNRTLQKQIGIYFAAPLFLASVFVMAGIGKVTRIINEAMHLEIDINAVTTILIFFLIYGGYYLATYLSCKRMILEPSGQ